MLQVVHYALVRGELAHDTRRTLIWINLIKLHLDGPSCAISNTAVFSLRNTNRRQLRVKLGSGCCQGDLIVSRLLNV